MVAGGGEGGDLETNQVQGDLVIFGLWRDFFFFLHCLSTVAINSLKREEFLPPRHLRRYLLMSKCMSLRG